MTLDGPKRFLLKNREKKIHLFRSCMTIRERLYYKPSTKLTNNQPRGKKKYTTQLKLMKRDYLGGGGRTNIPTKHIDIILDTGIKMNSKICGLVRNQLFS